jgi:O-antigen ligase
MPDLMVGTPASHEAGTARLAFFAYLAFIVAIYGAIASSFPALAKLDPAKIIMACAAVGLAWAIVMSHHRVRFGLAAGGGALWLFFLLVAASPAWSLWPALSAGAVGEAAKYLAAFVLAANLLYTRSRVRVTCAIIALASLAPAIGAMHSFVTRQHIVEDTRAAWIGTFANPNILAYHLVVSTPLALALRDSVEPRGAHSHLERSFWLGVVITFAAGVLLTQSRGGALGLGSVLLLWTVRGLARGKLAIGSALAVCVAIMMVPGGPWNRAETKARLAGHVDLSAQGRIDAWRTGLKIIEARPAQGVGAGAFIVGYDAYAPGDAGPPLTAHNSFMMIAAELGVPALLLFSLALGLAFRSLSKVANKLLEGDEADTRQAAIARGVQTAIFGFVVCSMTGGFAFTWPIYLCFGLATAIVLIERTETA